MKKGKNVLGRQISERGTKYSTITDHYVYLNKILLLINNNYTVTGTDGGKEEVYKNGRKRSK